tara:strand:- start:637 stop:966 length:330 start_codon:yes stop_codon:yes gene_type:complete
MKLYSIHYKGDENNPKTFEGVTDNFEKWLEEHNSHREEDCQERADNFEVKEIKLSLLEDENKKTQIIKIKSFKIYIDDTFNDKVLVGDDVETALEILGNNGYIVEVEYE